MIGEDDLVAVVPLSGIADDRGYVDQDMVARMQETRHDDHALGTAGHSRIDGIGDGGFGHLEVGRGHGSSNGRCHPVDQLRMRLLGAAVATSVCDQDRCSRGSHVATVRCCAVGDNHTRAGQTGDRVDEVGVGPHAAPWPEDERLDPELLEIGDRRNVVDEFRYWNVESIVEELDRRRFGYHVAIENWNHDFNIGTVVRNANAFGAAGVHIVGRRRWNRRGAMVTDRYCHVTHHPDPASLAVWAHENDLDVIGIDNLEGSVPLDSAPLPRACVLLFGQEGPGLSEQARVACAEVRSITMYGSTRSINAGVASGIAMHAWLAEHAP